MGDEIERKGSGKGSVPFYCHRETHSFIISRKEVGDGKRL